MTVQELIDELKNVDPNKEVKMMVSYPSSGILSGVDWVQKNSDSVTLHYQSKFGEDE